jgi:hypothetical protein
MGKGKNKSAKKCSTKIFVSYYIQGTEGPYKSDGSMLHCLTPGTSSAIIMETGMRVVDLGD